MLRNAETANIHPHARGIDPHQPPQTAGARHEQRLLQVRLISVFLPHIKCCKRSIRDEYTYTRLIIRSERGFLFEESQ